MPDEVFKENNLTNNWDFSIDILLLPSLKFQTIILFCSGCRREFGPEFDEARLVLHILKVAHDRGQVRRVPGGNLGGGLGRRRLSQKRQPKN